MALKQFFGGRIVLGTEFSGYKFGVFEPGTTTPKTTYKDSSLTVGNENTHPVILDANGAGQIWFTGNAKAIFYTSADVVVYTDDDINLESSSSSSASYNSALNGSFEDDTDSDGIPDSWTRTLYSGGSFLLDTTTQSRGANSVKFTSAGTGGGYIGSTALFSVKPNEPFKLSWDMKSSVADVRNLVQIFWYTANGSASSTASSTALDDSTTNPTSWTPKIYTGAVPSDAYFGEIRLTGCHSSDATAGSTWFDNVELIIRRLPYTIRSWISGLTISNNASDATNDIDIAVGEASDSTNVYIMTLGSALIKRLDTTWVVGTNQGGLDTGVVGNSVYHVFLIMRSDTMVVDVLFSLSATAPTMPTGYDYKRRIASFVRLAGANKAFSQFGDQFLWLAPVRDVNNTADHTTAQTGTLTVPTGIKVDAIISGLVNDNGTGNNAVLVTSIDQTDQAVDLSDAPGATWSGNNEAAYIAGSPIRMRTNTSAQIRYRANSATLDTIIITHGWVDYRGRFD